MLELGNGGVDVVFEFVGEAEIIVEVRVVGFGGEACAELFDGVIKVGLLKIGDAEVFAKCGA